VGTLYMCAHFPIGFHLKLTPMIAMHPHCENWHFVYPSNFGLIEFCDRCFNIGEIIYN